MSKYIPITQTDVKSYVSKHTLWQALNGTTINVHAAFDKSIIINLISGGKVIASERPQFKTYKRQREVMQRAVDTGTLSW